MATKLGVIADDFTGATDIASFMMLAGWRVMQLNGTPDHTMDLSQVDGVVISLKTRSCPAEEASRLSLAAAHWLQRQGCERLYVKYCSTFDSTPAGNIGTTVDALLADTGTSFAVLCPALPVNGRTVVLGHLFVHGQLLNESGMQNHPLTPMTDASLVRVMERQSQGKCGLVPLNVVRAGKAAISQHIADLRQQGYRYALLDALEEQDLNALAAAMPTDVLLTGGSGFAGAFAACQPTAGDHNSREKPPRQGAALILAGSCSVMTNRQVAHYRQQAPALALDVERALNDADNYLQTLTDWFHAQQSEWAPMIYATRPPQEVQALQQKYGVEATGTAIETLFARLAHSLHQQGVNKFIVAGGETSSLLVQRLEVSGFVIGDAIAPGVPWVKDIQRPLWLALKSGNFGGEEFFSQAQECCDE